MHYENIKFYALRKYKVLCIKNESNHVQVINRIAFIAEFKSTNKERINIWHKYTSYENLPNLDKNGEFIDTTVAPTYTRNANVSDHIVLAMLANNKIFVSAATVLAANKKTENPTNK